MVRCSKKFWTVAWRWTKSGNTLETCSSPLNTATSRPVSSTETSSPKTCCWTMMTTANWRISESASKWKTGATCSRLPQGRTTFLAQKPRRAHSSRGEPVTSGPWGLLFTTCARRSIPSHRWIFQTCTTKFKTKRLNFTQLKIPCWLTFSESCLRRTRRSGSRYHSWSSTPGSPRTTR